MVVTNDLSVVFNLGIVLLLMKYRMIYHLIREIKLKDLIKREFIRYPASLTRTSDP